MQDKHNAFKIEMFEEFNAISTYSNTIINMKISAVYPVALKSNKDNFKIPNDNHDGKELKSLHNSLREILIIAQILGLIPVMGNIEKSANALYFNWKSWKVLYCLFITSGTVFMMLMLIFKMVKSGADLNVISIFVFHCCKLGTTFAFLYLAKCWPQLMKDWCSMEVYMKSYSWPWKFELRIRLIAAIVLIIAVVQYFLHQVSNIVISLKCKPHNLTTLEYFYQVLTFPFIFSVLQYSGFTAALLQIIDMLSSLTWCYVDLFIMIMSSALALRFKQITKKIVVVSETKSTSENIWRNLREDYNRLCKLCRTLDDAISYIILMSFGTNLFFILILLFNSLRDMKSTLDKIYFFFSFGFLITRTIYVSLYAAWVNDESKKPIAILNSVPSVVYNLEIRRFIQQISFDSVALTGRNFFSVTRGLILSVAGAIVTYELVLIQFNENLLKDSANATVCIAKI